MRLGAVLWLGLLFGCGEDGIPIHGIALETCDAADHPIVRISAVDLSKTLFCASDLDSAPYQLEFAEPSMPGQVFQVDGVLNAMTICSASLAAASHPGTLTIEHFDAGHYAGKYQVMLSDGLHLGSFDSAICPNQTLLCP